MNDLFVYYHCDDWKMKDSMSLVGVYEEKELKQTIIEDVRNGDVELDDRTEEEILNMDIRTLESLLKYGHVCPVELNVRQ